MRFIALTSIFFIFSLQIVIGEQSGHWTYSVSSGQATITGYTGAGGAVTIPSSVNGIPVVQVGSGEVPIQGWASGSQQSITSISISQGISRIGRYAFYGSSITSVDIPNSVTELGEYAFYFCTNLTALTIPKSVVRIADGALCGLQELISFTLELPNSNFVYQNGVLFNQTQTFLIVAFPKCLSGATYTIPNTVTSIGILAFFNCDNLTDIAISSGVTNVGNGAFAGCASLTNITLPNNVASIGMYAFNGCASLESINMPVNLTSIGEEAFGNCSVSLVSSVIRQLVANQANNFTSGQQSVMANPNTHNLYTTSQIQNMAIGDLVLTKQVNGQFVLNYDIEQSTDLHNWTPYQSYALPLTGLPAEKAFVRVKMINSNPNPPPSTAVGGNI